MEELEEIEKELEELEKKKIELLRKRDLVFVKLKLKEAIERIEDITVDLKAQVSLIEGWIEEKEEEKK